MAMVMVWKGAGGGDGEGFSTTHLSLLAVRVSLSHRLRH